MARADEPYEPAERALAYMRERPERCVTGRDLMNALHITQGQAGCALGNLSRRGLAYKVGRESGWSLTTQPLGGLTS